jgi:hypothetical protein
VPSTFLSSLEKGKNEGLKINIFCHRRVDAHIRRNLWRETMMGVGDGQPKFQSRWFQRYKSSEMTSVMSLKPLKVILPHVLTLWVPDQIRIMRMCGGERRAQKNRQVQ